MSKRSMQCASFDKPLTKTTHIGEAYIVGNLKQNSSWPKHKSRIGCRTRLSQRRALYVGVQTWPCQTRRNGSRMFFLEVPLRTCRDSLGREEEVDEDAMAIVATRIHGFSAPANSDRIYSVRVCPFHPISSFPSGWQPSQFSIGYKYRKQ